MGSGDRFEERTDYLNTTENILPQENISLTLCQLGYYIRGSYERIAMKVRLRLSCFLLPLIVLGVISDCNKMSVLTYAIKNQRKARNAPSRGLWVP